MPFPNTLMQNRPFKTPIWALVIHLGVTILFICAPPAGDAFDFVISLNAYPTVLLLTAVTVGLIKLRLSKDEDSQSTFTSPWAVNVFYLAEASWVHSFWDIDIIDSLKQFLLVMPFVPPPNGKGSTSLPYWLSPVVALAILSLGIVYYLARFVLLPWIFGYRLELTTVDLSDGSQVSRYNIIKN